MTQSHNNHNVISFRSSAIKEKLLLRGNSPGLVAVQDLERYYALIALELAQIELTEAEASLICDALSATLLYEVNVVNPKYVVYCNCADAIQLNSLHTKWGVEPESFLNKLRNLTVAQALAIIDAVQRFWHDQNATCYSVGLCKKTD